MTLFLWAMLAVTCAGLMWALAAFDRLINIGSVAGDRTGGRLVARRIIPGSNGPSLSRLDRNRLFVKWLFRTPDWGGGPRNTRSLFRRFRFGSAIAFAGFVLFAAGAFLHI